ncbi:MAG TPA: alpha/beta hydrolase [Myxococcota bacterium]|nr:alpha/beta hydrolase [Myxococcota bacterium]
MPEKYVQVDGIATFVRHVGPTTLPEAPPDLSRGETVVCMHGAGGNSGLFTDVLERLGKAHSPLAFDFPGHARSGSLDNLGSISRIGAHARALLGKLGVQRCVLLGGSMGGMVALETALAAPRLVRALVLVASGARLAVSDEVLEKQRLITEGKARREFNRADYPASATPEMLRRGFMEDLKTDPRVAYQNMLAVRAFDRESDLARVACPTLVVVGEEDTETRASSELLATRIPGARKVVIPECGHRVALVAPEALAEAVLEFLASLPR